MNATEQITKVLGRHIGLNADWIACAWLIYANTDKSGSWFLVEDEETPNTFQFGFRASTDDAAFEVHETISTAEELTAFLDNLHGTVDDCRHTDLGKDAAPDERFVLVVGSIREEYPDIPESAQPNDGSTVIYDRQEQKVVVTIAPAYAQLICLELANASGFEALADWMNALSNDALASEGIPPTDSTASVIAAMSALADIDLERAEAICTKHKADFDTTRIVIAGQDHDATPSQVSAIMADIQAAKNNG